MNQIHNGEAGTDKHNSNEHNNHDPIFDNKPHTLLRANRLQVQEGGN